MNIGLFGDSYVDLVWYKHPEFTPPYERKIWAHRLMEELGSPLTTTGLGGSNQFYAINQFNRAMESGAKFDYVFFTFTWHHRMYIDQHKYQKVFSAQAENRDIYPEDAHLFEPGEPEKIMEAQKLYYEFMYNDKQALFNFEQQVRWCLELPEKYPDTKFIFLPNTEISREMALKYFNRGVLFDFAFETISAAEGDIIGVTVWQNDRIGHMSTGFHEIFKEIALDVVINYPKYENQIYQFDYSKFGIDRN
jgi:hypothetical protein